MMKEPTLIIMAAGMGSRYGGLKQIDPISKEGEIILDFSLYDAIKVCSPYLIKFGGHPLAAGFEIKSADIEKLKKDISSFTKEYGAMPGSPPPGFKRETSVIGTRRVIQGWDQGLMGMQVGGKRKLWVPAHLGYGERRVGSIPANANLIFEIELLDVLTRDD